MHTLSIILLACSTCAPTARPALFLGDPDNLKYPHLLHLVYSPIGHKPDHVPRTDCSLKNPATDNSPPERVIVGIEDEGSERGIGSS